MEAGPLASSEGRNSGLSGTGRQSRGEEEDTAVGGTSGQASGPAPLRGVPVLEGFQFECLSVSFPQKQTGESGN